MSYYTRVEIEWNDDDNEAKVDIEALLRSAEDYVRTRGWHQDAISDLRNAFKGTENDSWGFNNLWAEGVEDLILSMSRAFPGVQFSARGSGEQLEDTWYHEIKGSEIARSEGPFQDD